jgi:AcrR family transcriptional regulator
MNIAEVDQASAKPSMKERQRQLREDAILDAAVEFLQTKGFNAMTLEDITEAIGISRPTLYQHFSSKEDLLIHVGIRNLKTAAEQLAAMDPALSATERLRQFLCWCIDRKFGEHREMFYDMTRLVMSCGNDPRYAGPQGDFIKRLEELIGVAQEEGGVRNDVGAIILCEVILGAMKSLTFNRLVQDGKTSPAEIKDGLIKLLFCSSAE